MNFTAGRAGDVPTLARAVGVESTVKQDKHPVALCGLSLCDLPSRSSEEQDDACV
jgi:hypothetical protein